MWLERMFIRAERRIINNSIAIMIGQFDSNGDVSAIAQPLTMEKIDNPGIYRDPSIEIATEQAQELMDELWRCGLRPSEGSGSAGSLRATEKHLEDMRNIVSVKLNVPMIKEKP